GRGAVVVCTCLILVIVLNSLLFGFGVFKDGFHKLKDTVHESYHLDILRLHCSAFLLISLLIFNFYIFASLPHLYSYCYGVYCRR
ncbi:hypothetical protein LINPERHAP1_LOCUS35293, partial [Linum perenne]